MTNEIVISKKYKPLFQLLDNEHPEVDTVILTGGRGSAKSFNVALFSLIALVQNNWKVLYSRFTNVSIVDSIKPEVDSKIELLGYENYVVSTNTHIENKKGNVIAFKGIKTGSKQQTANLKSLSGFNVFVNDEAEELPDFETFEKVFLSIRSADERNLSLLILNPTSISHWIFRHFFESKGIEGGFNGIKDNVLYIHTSYLDIELKYLSKNIVNYYKRLKETDIEKYNHIVLGGWLETIEGRVFSNWIRISFSDYLKVREQKIYGVDWGKNHGFGIIEAKFDKYLNNLYCHELNSLSENQLLEQLSESDRHKINMTEGGIIVYTFNRLQIPKNAVIVCDSARPDNILLLREHGWEYAIGIDKPKGSVMAGITLLHSTNVFYTETSKGIDSDYKNYQYAKDRLGVVDDEVVKKNDDCLDPIRYIRRYLENN